MEDFLFKLPVQIDLDTQKSLVKFTMERGYSTAMKFNEEKRYLWKSVLLRHLDYDKIEKEIVDKYQQERRSIDFCFRNRIDLNWKWNEEIPQNLYQNLFDSLRPYIKHLNRVQVLLQRPGQGIPLHTDKMPGQQYDDNAYMPVDFDSSLVNNLHSQNQYLTLKIPLSETPEDNGLPTVEVNGEVYNYDVGNHAFAIDEYNIKHGAQACGHFRGVILVDGLFDVVKMRSDAIAPKFKKIQHAQIFRRIMKITRPNLKVSYIGHDDGRGDLRAVINDYFIMRLKSPHFLGAAFFYSEDQLSFSKHEFWANENIYREFYFQNRPFIEHMVAMYSAEEKIRSISTTRTGTMVKHDDLSSLEKLAIKNRMFLADNTTNNQKFYS